MRNLNTLATSALCLLGTSLGALAAGPTPASLQQSATAALLSPAGEGRRAYLKLNCYSCHGMFATGAMGPNIVHAEKGDVSEAVMQGQEGGMPSYKAYATTTDVNNLTAYLASIGTASEPVFMDWWKKNPPK